MSKFLVTPLLPICNKCKQISMIKVKLVSLSFRNKIMVKFVLLQCFSRKTCSPPYPRTSEEIDRTLPRIVSFENT